MGKQQPDMNKQMSDSVISNNVVGGAGTSTNSKKVTVEENGAIASKHEVSQETSYGKHSTDLVDKMKHDYASRSPSQNRSTAGIKHNGDIDLDKITPEFAAKIVKHFVLPMFENAPSAKVGRRLG